MGSTIYEILCFSLLGLSLSQYTKDIWTPSTSAIFHNNMRYHCNIFIYSRDDCENAYTRNVESKYSFNIISWSYKQTKIICATWRYQFRMLNLRMRAQLLFTWSKKKLYLLIIYNNYNIWNLFCSFHIEIITGRCAILSWSLVSIWRYDGGVFMDFNNITSIRSTRNCAKILVFICFAGTKAVNYDSFPSSFFEIFYA